MFGIIHLGINIYSQDWKKYPYAPEKSLISFPKDEGRHTNEPTEWWYFFSHLKGEESGTNYTVMFSFFYRDTLIFDGMRILNISNETTGEFFPDYKPLVYKYNSEDHLEIEADLFDHTENWFTKKDSLGNLIPFEYELHAITQNAALDIDMSVIKRPMILVDSGYLNQGINNYTYYYSFTGFDVKGYLTLNNKKEKVSGIGWFDKQYGNFHPEVREKYEWFSIQLSNNMDINVWNIFTTDNKLPLNPTYRLFNCYINDSTFYYTYNFDIEHKAYFYSPDSSRIYGGKFKLIEDSLGINLDITVQNPNCEATFPFPFYEGPIGIKGTVNGKNVTGKGFGELLHFYQFPELEMLEPSGYWDYKIPIQWDVKNPDEGRPLTYDLLVKNQDDNEFKYLARGLSENTFLIDTTELSLDTGYYFMVTATSVDSFLTDTIVSNGCFKPNLVTENHIFDNIIVAPNPFSDRLLIKMTSSAFEGGELELFSEKSKRVLRKSIDNNSSEILLNTNDLKQGIYILKLSNKNKFFIKKLIKVEKE